MIFLLVHTPVIVTFSTGEAEGQCFADYGQCFGDFLA